VDEGYGFEEMFLPARVVPAIEAAVAAGSSSDESTGSDSDDAPVERSASTTMWQRPATAKANVKKLKRKHKKRKRQDEVAEVKRDERGKKKRQKNRAGGAWAALCWRR
jgi:hypothetical protein